MPLTIIVDPDLPTTTHERQIISIIQTYIERQQFDDAKRILSHQTGRGLMRRRVIHVLDPDLEADDEP